jgi:dTDP-4-dehydrorhamnose 3,5-epimerase
MSRPFNLLPVALPGVRLLEPRLFSDRRGLFVKTYHEPAWREAGLPFAMREEYYSVSHRGVLRGMHFQTPPEDHTKVVYCPCGRVLDVLLDLRRSSPTFGQTASRELSAENRLILVIPTGIAHGFLTLEAGSVLVYKTGTVHSPAHDAGIRWDSFGFDWGCDAPVLSERDAAFPALADFASPFG